MRVISIKIPEKLLDEIDKYAVNHGFYRSEIIRLAIIEFLDNHTKNKENDKAKVEKIKL
jgi:metal-responsive CopG/Arc/MetJ family transcriptional regulator